MTRPTFDILVTSPDRGLGYCCVWLFFARFKQTSLISHRLGVDRATVKRWKARWRTGEFRCEKCERCMVLKLARSLQSGR